MSAFDSVFGTDAELAESMIDRHVAASRARMDADEDRMLAGPDDEDYLDRPALSRTHPYTTGTP